jgi:hypothetical protein
MNDRRYRNRIKRWMAINLSRFVDEKTNEVDATKMVEIWDMECSTGESTLDSDHPAWEIASEIAIEYAILHKVSYLLAFDF